MARAFHRPRAVGRGGARGAERSRRGRAQRQRVERVVDANGCRARTRRDRPGRRRSVKRAVDANRRRSAERARDDGGRRGGFGLAVVAAPRGRAAGSRS